MNRPGRRVALADIAEEMQQYMDTSTPHFVDELIEIARYLNERGWIKKQTAAYEIISITAAGIDEVERQSIPEPSTPPSPASMYFPPEDEEYAVKRMQNAELRVIPGVWGHFAGGGLNEEDIRFIDGALKELLSE